MTYWKPTKRLFTETMMKMMRMTTPHGCESFTWAHLPSPPNGGAPGSRTAYGKGSTWIDEHGNYHVSIPGNGRAVMWASHCDTADGHPTPVCFKRDGDMLRTDGRSILGADDKTGCTIMAMMIRSGVPGHYVFFAGEEVGCVGSKALAKETDAYTYDVCISFDRKGYDSIVTHQMGSRCCSDDWAAQLAEELNKDGFKFAADPTGVYTDSLQFSDLIPECTNISVGYMHQHTPREQQDIDFAYRLCLTMIRIGHANAIPAPLRNPMLVDDDDKYFSYGSRHYWGGGRDCDPDFITEHEWRNSFDDDKENN